MPEPTIAIMMSSNEGSWKNLIEYLEPAGFHIVWFSKKENCLEYCEEHSPQVIILEPPFIGALPTEMIQAIRQISKCPILILSTFRAETVVKMLNAGADDCQQKPFNKDVLIAKLNNLVRRYQYSQK
jgi:DNA-binding response OmpR family regulator